MKVASITEQVLTLVNKRLGLYRHMDEVVNRYKQSRDTGTLNSGRKTLEADHRTLTNEISSLQARLKAEGSDLAEKVSARTRNEHLTGEHYCGNSHENILGIKRSVTADKMHPNRRPHLSNDIKIHKLAFYK